MSRLRREAHPRLLAALVALAWALLATVAPRTAMAQSVSSIITPSGATFAGGIYEPPARLIDGSGLSGTGPILSQTHAGGYLDNPRDGANFKTTLGIATSTPIDFALGGTFDLTAVHVWNYTHSQFAFYSARDARVIDVSLSTDGSTFAPAGSITLTSSSAFGESVQSFTIAGTATHVRFQIRSNYGDAHEVGLGEVRFAGASLVPPDTTPPTITGSRNPLPNAAGWNNTDVTVSFSCDDNAGGSGVATCSGPTTLGQGANQSVTGTAKDNAGNTASATVSGINVDKTAPTITGAPDRSANANGWYNANVTVSFTCADTLAGVASCAGPVTLSASESNQSASGAATDNAGNSSSATVGGINIDKAAPAAAPSASPAPNSGGWNNTNVTVIWNWSDAGSGIDPGTCPTSSVSSGEGTVTVSATCADKAGNIATASHTAKVDKTKPAASVSVSPAANANGWNNTDVTVTFSATDSLSGVASCAAPVVLSAEGSGQSAAGTCTDNAGNVSDPATASGINIDKTNPVVAYSGNVGTYTVDQAVNISCAATDALSGIASTTCANITSPAHSFTLGANTRSAQATDRAGNVGAASTNFTVTVSAQSINNVIDQLAIDPSTKGALKGHINSIASAPNASAKTGKLQAFQNSVEAQRGKKLTDAQADLLLRLAGAL